MSNVVEHGRSFTGPALGFHKLARPNFCKPLRIVVVVEPITAVCSVVKLGLCFEQRCCPLALWTTSLLKILGPGLSEPRHRRQRWHGGTGHVPACLL